MAYSTFRSKVLKGFVWIGCSNMLGQLITWLATLIVIRLLLPSDYGLMAMATICVNFAATICEFGITSSIIRSETITDEELRGIFGFLLVSSVLFWLLMFFSAPLVANFYDEPRLTAIIRVLSSIFLIIPMYKIPESLLIRKMNFKDKARVDVLVQIMVSLLSLVLAFQGRGVWTLVVALIALHCFKLIGYNLIQPTLLRPSFTFGRVKGHLKYGMILTWEQMLHYLYATSDKIIVGKVLGENLLGIYSVALNLASIPVEKVLPIVTQIAFTSYARIQNDMERIRRNILRSVRAVSIFVFPVFFGMAAIANEAVPLVLGDKWQSIIIPFQIICFILPLKALSALLPPALFAIDRAWINLTNKAFSCCAMIAAFSIGVSYGLIGVCYSWLLIYPLVFLLTTIRCLHALKLSVKQYFLEILYPFVGSVLMLSGLLVLKNSHWISRPSLFLVVSVLSGAVFYLSFFLFLRKESIVELQRLFIRSTSSGGEQSSAQ